MAEPGHATRLAELTRVARNNIAKPSPSILTSIGSRTVELRGGAVHLDRDVHDRHALKIGDIGQIEPPRFVSRSVDFARQLAADNRRREEKS